MEYSKLPDLKEWLTFRLVVDLGGVQAAAERLHIGQPAVSKRLHRLEQCYGMALTERVAGRLRLTATGEKVYVLATQTLDRHQQLLEELQASAQGRTNLQLETTSAIAEHFLPRLLMEFSKQNPQYKVKSQVAYSREIQNHLAQGTAELGLLEDTPEHAEILLQKWLDDELWLVCGRNHPLAAKDCISLNELQQLSFVLREPQSGPGQALMEALQSVGIASLNTIMEVGSSDTIIDILTSNEHASFLPRFIVRGAIADKKLLHVEVKDFLIRRTLWIARHQQNIDHPVANAFIALLRKLYK